MLTNEQAAKLEVWRKGAIEYAQSRLGVPWVDAEDCVQEAILRIQAHGKPREDYTVGYLGEVLKKVVADYARRKAQWARGGRDTHVELDEARAMTSNELSPLDNAVMVDAIDKASPAKLAYNLAIVMGEERKERERLRQKMNRRTQNTRIKRY